jgi:hypothetical protein
VDRETKKLETPSGKEVELKTYLTVREQLELRDVFLRHMKIEGTEVKEVSGIAVADAERKLLELAVVSYDGSKERILERILDSTSKEDYDFIVAEAQKLQTGNFQMAR